MEGIRRTEGHILRRYSRLSLDFNSPYNPEEATPEENTFEFKRGDGAMVGRIVFKEFSKNRAVADTPWEEMRLSKTSFIGPYEISADGNPVARFSFNLSRTKVKISFAKGERLKFRTKLITMGLSSETDSGKVEVEWEGEYGPGDVKQKGLIRRDMPKEVVDMIEGARADYKARKKAKAVAPGEPNSLLIPYYIQWRVLLPKSHEGRHDMISALAFITSYRCLKAESPGGPMPAWTGA
jgi:hypothetical protein